MKLLMDADCLIKLTKSGLKELVVENYEIFIPAIVEAEVVDAGLAEGHADALIVQENIRNECIAVVKAGSFRDGDTALSESFSAQHYDAVATDDQKLIKILSARAIPYFLPAVILYDLCRQKITSRDEAMNHLVRLKPFISSEELNAVKILMEAL